MLGGAGGEPPGPPGGPDDKKPWSHDKKSAIGKGEEQDGEEQDEEAKVGIVSPIRSTQWPSFHPIRSRWGLMLGICGVEVAAVVFIPSDK